MSAYVDDANLTLRLAMGTSEILKGVRNVGLLSGRHLGDAGDDLAQNWIARVLAQHRPEDGFLSEEAMDNQERLARDRVWIIDPLDGTREFASGRQDWAVHIALIEHGEPIHAAVGLPDKGVTFWSEEAKMVKGPLAHKVVVSRNRPPAIATPMAEAIDAKVEVMGSAGAKAMYTLLGDFDAYIHAGGQYEWDSAAPVGVAKAAGLHCSRLDGSALKYNQEDTFLPDLLICRPELAGTLLEAAAKYHDEHGSY